MNFIKQLSSLFLLAALWVSTAHAQSINHFYYEEREALYWQQQFALAPSGSWEEQRARQNRDIAIERAIQAVNSYSTFSGMHWTQIESFADQMNQKFSTAPSGGAIERMYRQVRDVSYSAFQNELQRHIEYSYMDWRQIHELALQMDQKFSLAPSGSRKEQIYNQARRTAYQKLPPAVDQANSQSYDYRHIENMGEEFHRLYSLAPSGSLKESIYNQIRRSSYNQALSKFQQQAYYMTQSQLWQIQEEYNRKFSLAPSGSLQESYYRQIRDIARRSIRP